MADTTEIAWILEGPRRGGIRRFVGNPHGEPRYVEGSMGAHKFSTKADAEAARRSGEVVHQFHGVRPVGRK
jgi:hypothetical protein